MKQKIHSASLYLDLSATSSQKALRRAFVASGLLALSSIIQVSNPEETVASSVILGGVGFGLGISSIISRKKANDYLKKASEAIKY